MSKKKPEQKASDPVNKAMENAPVEAQLLDTEAEDMAKDSSALNRETGVLTWQELVRFFARGVVIKVDKTLDLLAVGERVAADDAVVMQEWLDKSLVSRASDDDARDWTERQPEFWCLVTAPWVLVQECDPKPANKPH